MNPGHGEPLGRRVSVPLLIPTGAPAESFHTHFDSAGDFCRSGPYFPISGGCLPDGAFVATLHYRVRVQNSTAPEKRTPTHWDR